MKDLKAFLRLSRIDTTIITAGYILLFFLVLLGPNKPVYDEILFYPNLALYEQQGLSQGFLLNMKDQAPGPLYEMVHFTFHFITNYKFPAMRVLNLLLFGGTVIILRLILKNFKTSIQNPAFIIIGLPLIWPISGMALTEMPAMFFGTLATYFILSLAKTYYPWSKFLLAIIAAISISLSISGRVNFIAIPIATLVFAFINKGSNIIYFIIIPVLSVMIVSPIFWVWQNLVPPNQSYVNSSGINVWYGILACSYSSLLVFFISPGWFVVNKKIASLLIFLFSLLCLLNITFNFIHFQAIKSVFSKIGSPIIDYFSEQIIPCLFITVALLFIYSLVVRIFEDRFEPQKIYFYLILILILGTSVKISHQFSSRYVAQVIPFLMVVTSKFQELTVFRIVLVIIAVGMGSYSLISYYNFPY